MHELQPATRIYIVLLLGVAVGVTVAVLPRQPFGTPYTLTAALIVAGCMTAAWLFPIHFAPRTKLYVDTAVTVAAVLLVPPGLAAIAIGTGTFAAHAVRQESRDWAQATFNAAQATLVALAAALLLSLAGWNVLRPSFAQPRLLLVFPIVAMAMYLLNVFLVSSVTALELTQPIGRAFRRDLAEDFRTEALAHASLVTTGLLAAMVAGAYGWAVALLAVPAVSTHVALHHLAQSRHKAERARIMSDAGLAEAQRLAHIGSWEWLPETDRWVWSDEMYRLLGMEPGAVRPNRQTLLTSIPPSDRARLEHLLHNAQHESRPFVIEHRLLLPDGTERSMNQRAAPLGDPGQQPRILGTMQDVTEQAQAAEAMRLAKEAAQEADRTKTHLLSMASHDLRTPLTAIQGYIEIVMDGSAGDLNEEQVELLRVAHRNSIELTALVNDLLDLSRIAAGHLQLRIRPVDIGLTVADLVHSLAPQARAKGIRLISAPGHTAVWLQADPARLGQILQNLLGNAIKFTERGQVSVAVTAQDCWVEVAVTDTGIGIPPESLPFIFDEFSQGSDEAVRRGGAGLGLTIVKQLAELHGGSVSVQSVLGEGSTFTLRLPIRPPPE